MTLEGYGHGRGLDRAHLSVGPANAITVEAGHGFAPLPCQGALTHQELVLRNDEVVQGKTVGLGHVVKTVEGQESVIDEHPGSAHVDDDGVGYVVDSRPVVFFLFRSPLPIAKGVLDGQFRLGQTLPHGFEFGQQFSVCLHLVSHLASPA